jgi:hypothetical protein
MGTNVFSTASMNDIELTLAQMKSFDGKYSHHNDPRDFIKYWYDGHINIDIKIMITKYGYSLNDKNPLSTFKTDLLAAINSYESIGHSLVYSPFKDAYVFIVNSNFSIL